MGMLEGVRGSECSRQRDGKMQRPRDGKGLEELKEGQRD